LKKIQKGLSIKTVHRKASERAKKRYFPFAVERTAKEKHSIATRYFWVLNARRAWFLLYSVLSTENNKIYHLWVLCDSNERSEWAVKEKNITKWNILLIMESPNEFYG